MRVSIGHSHTHAQSTAYSEDVNSAATTLLGSACSSKDGYAEIELSRHGGPTQALERHEEESDGEDGYDGESDDKEDAGLLGETSHSAVTNAFHAPASLPDDPDPLPPESKAEQPVSWSQLPRKGQLAILTLARLSEPLTQTSLQAYMFYQLKSFTDAAGTPPSDGKVARQAGLLAAAFTGAQFCTAILWGRVADSERMGRKKVILVGLMGTAVMSLGFGFSESFGVAMFWRCLGGLLNGNVGVMRTMVAEMIKEKRYQSRAFLLMPMTFNIGVILGPLMGGLLADPVGTYPALFGPRSTFGGENGVWWMLRWPYALPNVVNAVILTVSTLALVLGLDETLDGLKDRRDYGIEFRRLLSRLIFRRKESRYTALSGQEGPVDEDVELNAAELDATNSSKKKPRTKRKLPLRRMWTPNVLSTLLSHGLMACHVGTFNMLWFVFLSTPRYDPTDIGYSNGSRFLGDADSTLNDTVVNPKPLQHIPNNYKPHGPFTFTGGLALPPSSIGAALAILGILGISLQLLIYPHLSFLLGTVRSLRYSLCLFPIAYALAPYLAILPSSTPPPGQSSGFLVWIGIAFVLCVQVMARTFALPSNTILVNNSCPHPSVLGTLHGVAQSVSAGMRTAGPMLVAWLYSLGLSAGVVGLAWWVMAGLAVVGAVAGLFVREGDGHEIWLEGEREEAEKT